MSSSATPPVTQPTSRKGTTQLLSLWGTIACVGLAALIMTYVLFVKAPPPRKIVMASGQKAGAYYHSAQKYAEVLRRDGLTLEVRETRGSVENLQLLADEESEVSVAICQSGIAGPTDRERLVALGSLYREPLWVFYRSDRVLNRLSELAGRRVGIGPAGSGTNVVAIQLLRANGLVGPTDSAADTKVTLHKGSVASAAQALRDGELDAAVFVSGFDAEYVKTLITDERIRLLSFQQHEAYHRRFRFLSQVTVPAGLVNLGENLPPQDVFLIAPTAMLVANKDLHPALVSVLLTAATRIHQQGDEFSHPGEFPSASFTDLPVSEEAQHFYKSGPPVLQRLLPFWLASLVDRLKIMLIPLVMLLMPLIRTAPPLVRWRTRRKIYLWYAALRDIDQKCITGLSGSQFEVYLARLKTIEQQVAFVAVPLSYMEEFYHLRLHLTMVREQLEKVRAEQGAKPAG